MTDKNAEITVRALIELERFINFICPEIGLAKEEYCLVDYEIVDDLYELSDNIRAIVRDENGVNWDVTAYTGDLMCTYVIYNEVPNPRIAPIWTDLSTRVDEPDAFKRRRAFLLK